MGGGGWGAITSYIEDLTVPKTKTRLDLDSKFSNFLENKTSVSRFNL